MRVLLAGSTKGLPKGQGQMCQPDAPHQRPRGQAHSDNASADSGPGHRGKSLRTPSSSRKL